MRVVLRKLEPELSVGFRGFPSNDVVESLETADKDEDRGEKFGRCGPV